MKKDEVLLKLAHAKPILSADCQTERPIVACGLSDGSVSVWDLEEMQLISQEQFKKIFFEKYQCITRKMNVLLGTEVIEMSFKVMEGFGEL